MDERQRRARGCGDRGGRRGRARRAARRCCGSPRRARPSSAPTPTPSGSPRPWTRPATPTAAPPSPATPSTCSTSTPTRDWAARTEKDFGRVDGLVHLVGGWRGSETFTETSLADWDFLEMLLIRTVQHTSLAFHDGAAAQRPRPVRPDQRRRREQAHRGQRRLRRRQGRRRGVDARPGRLLPQGGGRGRARRPRLPSWWSRHWCTTRCAPSARTRSSRASPTSRSWPRPSPASGSRPAAEVNGNRLWLTAANPPRTDARRHHDPRGPRLRQRQLRGRPPRGPRRPRPRQRRPPGRLRRGRLHRAPPARHPQPLRPHAPRPSRSSTAPAPTSSRSRRSPTAGAR